MLNAFCAAARIQPNEVLVVGDAAHDFAMARAGGAAYTVGVLTGVTPAAVTAATVTAASNRPAVRGATGA